MTQLDRFKAALAEHNFDGAIISSEINQRYLCDFPFSDGYILVTQGKSYVLTDFRYIEAAKKAIVGFEILCPTSSMADTIADLLRAENAERVAVEESTISLQEYNRFLKGLDGIASLFEGASDILLSQRAIKLDYEIERIKKAQSITDAAFSYIVEFISKNNKCLIYPIRPIFCRDYPNINPELIYNGVEMLDECGFYFDVNKKFEEYLN